MPLMGFKMNRKSDKDVEKFLNTQVWGRVNWKLVQDRLEEAMKKLDPKMEIFYLGVKL